MEEIEKPKEESQELKIRERGIRALLSPEGILMLIFAISLDLAGLVEFIPVIGNLLSYLPDILGTLIIGGWILFRSQTLGATRRAAARIGKAGKWARRLRWLRPLLIIGEYIPVGGMLPFWSILVFLELRA